MVGVAELKPHPRKTRTHYEQQIAVITCSFTSGSLNPIVIDESNIVLAGDARPEAARRPGTSALPTIRIDYLSELEKRAYKVAQPIAELAEWDLPELSIELTKLIDIDFNMDALGFHAPTIDLLPIEAARKPTRARRWGRHSDDDQDLPYLAPATSGRWVARVTSGSALDPEG